MTKITSYDEASSLVAAHLKPGVVANHVMTKDEYVHAISTDSLFAYRWFGGLVFFRKQEDCQLMTYLLHDLKSHPDYIFAPGTFCEIPENPRTANLALAARDYWKKAGFIETDKRIRLSRAPVYENPMPVCGSDQPKPWDRDDVLDLLKSCFFESPEHIFFPVGGHDAFCTRDDDGRVCGYLYAAVRPSYVELRLLAVGKNMRGRGHARKLIDMFTQKFGHKKNTVWAAEGNSAALNAYTSSGFMADGWRSLVLKVI